MMSMFQLSTVIAVVYNRDQLVTKFSPGTDGSILIYRKFRNNDNGAVSKLSTSILIFTWSETDTIRTAETYLF
jgi:hypothetical protein